MECMTLQRRQLAAVPDAPPAEVLAQIADAGAVYDELAAQGRRLHFELHPRTGALTIQLLDASGRELRTVSPRGVLDIAAGAPVL
jgi:hypothetical protein